MDELMVKLKESASYIKSVIGEDKVDIAIVLDSGLGELGEKIEDAIFIDYHDIPHFPVSTVPGHKGRLVVGSWRIRGSCACRDVSISMKDGPWMSVFIQ